MPDELAPTDQMIEAGAKTMHDNPPPPASSVIDWLEVTEDTRKFLRHMARVSYLAMEEWRANA